MLEGYKEELEEMKIHSKRYLDELIASEEVWWKVSHMFLHKMN
jgi:hypothetical protein